MQKSRFTLVQSVLLLLSACATDPSPSPTPPIGAPASVAALNSTQTLSCTGHYQPGGAGKPVQKVALDSTSTENGPQFKGAKHGYDYEVLWHQALSSLYMSIKKDGATLLFTTARVPTKDHNDSMGDVRLPDLRLYLSCDFIGFRP